MTYDRFLDLAGNWAAILTAVVAVFAYGKFLIERSAKRRRVERYLRGEKGMGYDEGQRTVLHLMSNLRMSEREVLDAAFQSRVIGCRTGQDERGRADALFFEYDDGKPAPDRPGKARI